MLLFKEAHIIASKFPSSWMLSMKYNPELWQLSYGPKSRLLIIIIRHWQHQLVQLDFLSLSERQATLKSQVDPRNSFSWLILTFSFTISKKVCLFGLLVIRRPQQKALSS